MLILSRILLQNWAILYCKFNYNSLCVLLYLAFLFVFSEKVIEKEDLVLQSIGPIFNCMSTRSFDIIVLNVKIKHLLVKWPVYRNKEIINATINNYCQIFVINQIQLIYHRVFFPVFRKLSHISESFGQIPILGKWPKINATTHASWCTKYIVVTYW